MTSVAASLYPDFTQPKHRPLAGVRTYIPMSRLAATLCAVWCGNVVAIHTPDLLCRIAATEVQFGSEEQNSRGIWCEQQYRQKLIGYVAAVPAYRPEYRNAVWCNRIRCI
jgi:hypothetical protein